MTDTTTDEHTTDDAALVAAAMRVLAARGTLAQAAVDAERHGETATLDTLAVWFDALDELLDDVRLVHSLASRRLGERMHAEHVDRLDRDDAPPVELNVSKSRTGWQHDRLREKVVSTLRQLAIGDVDRVAVNPATGEPVPTFDQALDGLLYVYRLGGDAAKLGRTLKDGTTKGGLRSLGIDPDDYCQGGNERPTYSARVVR